MVKILIDEKMVQKDDKGIFSLTQKGSECAKEIYEKHCFSYELLVSAGIDDKLAQKEVCKFHSGNILNKKFHLEMVRDLKADCAKRTEEVCSGFCNIGSGVSLKRQK